jgi:uncharacterized membrane protein YtjA (UPF0391 family)
MEWYTIRSVFTKGVSQKLPRPSAGGVSYVLQTATTASDCKAEPTRGHCLLPAKMLLVARGAIMLHYAVVFFIIALVAAFFGFGGIAASAAGIGKILFVVFLIGAVVSFLMSIGRRA